MGWSLHALEALWPEEGVAAGPRKADQKQEVSSQCCTNGHFFGLQAWRTAGHGDGPLGGGARCEARCAGDAAADLEEEQQDVSASSQGVALSLVPLVRKNGLAAPTPPPSPRTVTSAAPCMYSTFGTDTRLLTYVSRGDGVE